MKHFLLHEEVVILSNYLVGLNPTKKDLELFTVALDKYDLDITDAGELKLWILCLKNPWLFPYIDGGLSILDKDCIFRKRLFYFLNILEVSTTNYSKFILEKQNKYLVIVKVFYLSFIGLIKSLIGILIVKIFK
tara:strand:+ start:454 stop:855 length:402 start_codon:yes stop_codon:yes gene_type:complete